MINNFLFPKDCYFGTGHGASVGSVGSTTVKNITFSNIKMKNTVNGPRIKTLAGYSGGKVKDIYFEDFTMEKVKHDMVIDGLYHDNDKTVCCWEFEGGELKKKF